MYNFVFWFFYKFFEWRKGFKSSFLAAAMVGFAMEIHLALLYAIVRYFTGLSVGGLTGSYGQRRLILLPFAIAWCFIIYYIYYKKKAPDILEKYTNEHFSKTKNILFIILLLVVPLVVAIKLTNVALGLVTK